MWTPTISMPGTKEDIDGGYLGLPQLQHHPVAQHTAQAQCHSRLERFPMCQKVEFAGWARFKPKVTPYSLRDVDTPDHRRLRATSRDKAELAEPGSVPGYIESFTASRHHDDQGETVV